MIVPLLKTKFHIPPLRAGSVPRTRLFERLEAGLRGGMILVSAPAGFGKTTLVSAWIEQYRHPTAWLALDAGDNDVSRFLQGLIAALQTLAPGLGTATRDVLQSPQPPPIEVVLVDLLNELSALSGEYVLVLDDYHFIKTPAVHDALAFLLDHRPSSLHWVLATRSDPPLPLARLRARGQLVELRGADLRFTAEEAALFLNESMGLALSAEDVGALENRTEGWIAGLQLAALALQAPGQVGATRFIESFTGNHQYVLDYLMEEVLLHQPGFVQSFLLRTSILERLSGELCDALLEGPADAAFPQPAALTLEQLDRANLFLIPLDAERRWYRYHHLFADLLRGQLQRFHAREIAVLHRRAAAWYEAHGFIPEAIDHALAAGDQGAAAELIDRYAFPALLRGEQMTVKEWLERLPETERGARPGLCVDQAWVLMLSGKVAEVEAQLQRVEATLATGPAALDTPALCGQVATLRAYAASFTQDAGLTATLAQTALRILPPEDISLRSIVSFILGAASYLQADLEGARAAFLQAGELGLASGNIHIAVPALAAVGDNQFTLGRLHRAEAVDRELLETIRARVGEASPLMARVYGRISSLYYEWNRLDEAEHYAVEGLALARRWGNPDVLMKNYVALCDVRRAQGDLEAAQTIAGEAGRLMQSVRLSPGIFGFGIDARVKTWLARDELDAAAAWASTISYPPAGPLEFVRELEFIALARVLLALERETAAGLLDRLAAQTEAGGRMSRFIEVLTLQALFRQARGESGTARTYLKRALLLAQPEGYIRTFIDKGLPLGLLLQQIRTEQVAPDYVTELLAAMGQSPVPAPAGSGVSVEPLSERELEVLQMVAAGHNNAEIAGRLFVALSTVKKHVNHIYDKLGVRSRTQAVARARALGLLK